jgi:ornithine carbamoyltransferase
MNSFLSVLDISQEDLYDIFERTKRFKDEVKHNGMVKNKSLDKKIIGLLFEKPSTRTRTSFEVAVLRLGGLAVYLPSSELQLSRGEPVKDTARILGGYLDSLIARVYTHDTVSQISNYSNVPVVNGLSDLEHPTQIVCDLFTIWEIRNKLKGYTLAFIGDGNNMCNSFLLGTALTGMNMSIACPKDYGPDENILEKARAIADNTGSQLKTFEKPKDAVKGADILYTDVWVSMGQEEEREKRLKIFKEYQINRDLLKHAKEDAMVMHCLPAHRGLEITDDVIEGSHSIVWQQGENKLYGAMGILDFIFNKHNNRGL